MAHQVFMSHDLCTLTIDTKLQSSTATFFKAQSFLYSLQKLFQARHVTFRAVNTALGKLESF